MVSGVAVICRHAVLIADAPDQVQIMRAVAQIDVQRVDDKHIIRGDRTFIEYRDVKMGGVIPSKREFREFHQPQARRHVLRSCSHITCVRVYGTTQGDLVQTIT